MSWDVYSQQSIHMRNRLYDMVNEVDFSNPNTVVLDGVTVAQAQQLIFESRLTAGWCRPRRKATFIDWICHPIILGKAQYHRLLHRPIKHDEPVCQWLGIVLYGDEPLLGSVFGVTHPCYITIPETFPPVDDDSLQVFASLH